MTPSPLCFLCLPAARRLEHPICRHRVVRTVGRHGWKCDGCCLVLPIKKVVDVESLQLCCCCWASICTDGLGDLPQLLNLWKISFWPLTQDFMALTGLVAISRVHVAGLQGGGAKDKPSVQLFVVEDCSWSRDRARHPLQVTSSTFSVAAPETDCLKLFLWCQRVIVMVIIVCDYCEYYVMLILC